MRCAERVGVIDIVEPRLGYHFCAGTSRQEIARLREEEEELTTHHFLKLAKSLERAKKRAAAAALTPAADHDTIRIGAFQDILPTLSADSVDLVFTDPPYGAESVPLYHQLAEHAARILKPGASLVCYDGQFSLPEVLPGMTAHLRYWWTCAVLHSGAAGRIPARHVHNQWKPVLWLVKGRRRDDSYLTDVLKGQQSKEYHDWEQSESEAAYFIEHLTRAGELVVDPMCGSGTTVSAAVKLGRRCFACDIDPAAVAITQKRLTDLTAETPCRSK
jgi:16S rRNA G966 N2-methylase RsmD